MVSLAAALHLQGDRVGALHWWDRAWAAGNVVAGYNLGMLHAAAGDANRAQVAWEKAAAFGDPDAMLGLVKHALDRGDAVGVKRWAPVILAQDEAFPITALGVAFRDGGDLPHAMHAFLRAEELGDGYAMTGMQWSTGPGSWPLRGSTRRLTRCEHGQRRPSGCSEA
ncbi:hypothetical protein C8250_000125 [Streptomyces sp. So13.3]|uniref:hypothetical protein n=1 Tax=Streptomyces sp. So13.3 TaxID=2136173 RepID=UPI001106C8C2|nr:hypothetical protein [Streptomyces sp. So13.3]QNA70584.1 hypothetical protein C8250_000125 [Streptomyces sp. So13.3]